MSISTCLGAVPVVYFINNPCRDCTSSIAAKIRHYIYLYHPRQWVFRAMRKHKQLPSSFAGEDGSFVFRKGIFMGYIYKIQNQIDGAVYIGKTIDYMQRWRAHRAFAKREGERSKGPLYKAIKKYGIDNFSFSIIEECKDSELSEREKYWISEYCATDRTRGYNISSGGNNDCKRVCQYSEDMELLGTYKGIRAASEMTGLSQNSIKYACEGITSKCGGFLWRYEGSPVPGPDHTAIHGRYTATARPVDQYDLNGKYIRSFRSLNNAQKETGIRIKLISQCCHGQKDSVSGYKWKFAKK